jgi:cytochrome c
MLIDLRIGVAAGPLALGSRFGQVPPRAERPAARARARAGLRFGETEEIDMRHLVFAAVVLAASTGTTWAQDVDAGAQLFKQCGACHKIGPGAAKFVGPELNGLDGRKAGSTDYNYSDAMKSSEITWNEASFKEYIKAPKAKVPDTKMTYPGITDEKKIANLWAYIKQFDDKGEIKK